jgi:signal transduction histidine kinase
LKHASATKASIVLRYDRPVVELEVADNGSGVGTSSAAISASDDAPEVETGHGIEGMRERAGLYGGSLRAGPADGGGWLVSAALVDAAPQAP